MEPLKPTSNIEEDQLRRAAARAGLHFHVEVYQGGWGRLTTHAGCNSETRDATGPELQMWLGIVGRVEGTLEADMREFEARFIYDTPVYLCPSDVRILRCSADFKITRNEWGSSHYGTFKKTPVYVCPAIPEGYYLDMGRAVPELSGRPPLPELDDALRWELEDHLQPLMM